ncbi:MAG: hypothetical protein ACRC46_11615 [Thermoguttaceae bacterium]
MQNRQVDSITLLVSLPRSLRRRWIDHTFAASHHRELAETAADLVAFPQPLDAPSLRDSVVDAAETILAPHQNSLRRTVARYRWRFLLYAAGGAGAAVVVCAAATLLFTISTKTAEKTVVKTASVTNSGDATSIAIRSPQTESPTEKSVRAVNGTSLARLAALTKGEFLRSVGKTPSELTPAQRDARTALAAAFDSLEKYAVADAVRCNRLGVALSLQAALLRESGIDVVALQPATFPELQSELAASVHATQVSNDVHDAALVTSTNDTASDNRTRGGSDSGVLGTPHGHAAISSAAWGEFPMPPQSRSPFDEVILLPPQYRRAGQRFVGAETR